MFYAHEYDPVLHKYTHIASYKEELQDTGYKKSDVIIVHEDFETGALDDVFEERVTKDRWPKNVYKFLGEKLRCTKPTLYKYYTNFNTSKKAQRHMQVDLDEMYSKLYMVKKITKKEDVKVIKHNLTSDYSNALRYNFVVVSLIDSDTDISIVDSFLSSCDALGLNYMIYRSKKAASKVDKSVLVNMALNKTEENSLAVVYMDIRTKLKTFPNLFTVKNMDFMTINLNQTKLEDSGKCTDPRVLRTINDNLYYFANNNVTRQFLSIWHDYNKTLSHQHKNLEYAFNVSIAINKMRCYWVPKEYIFGPVLKFATEHKSSFLNNKYSNKNQKIKKHTKQVQQCGLKPPLNEDGEALKTHHSGSRYKSGFRDLYSKQFLEF
jgi:hypothetical protein